MKKNRTYHRYFIDVEYRDGTLITYTSLGKAAADLGVTSNCLWKYVAGQLAYPEFSSVLIKAKSVKVRLPYEDPKTVS